MTQWRKHRRWIALMFAALFVLATGVFFVDPLQSRTDAAALSAKHELDSTLRAIAQLQDDMETAQKLQNEIAPASVERAMAHVNRLKAASILERRANENYLSELRYNFAPEQPLSYETVGAGKQFFAQSILSVESQAASDTGIYSFIDSLSRSLPGRLDLLHVKIERPALDAPITAANVHLTLQAVWVSNGGAAPLTEGAP